MKMICPKHKECPYGSCDYKESHPENRSGTHKSSCIDCPDHCIPYVEFKVGDRVRVLGKTTGCPITMSSCNIGDVAWVNIIKKDGTLVVSSDKGEWGDFFLLQDLELIEEDDMPDKPKYQTTNKTRSVATIYKDVVKSDCREVFEQFTNFLYALKIPEANTIINEAPFLNWIAEDSKIAKWAIEKGYIEEVQPEVFYSIGERFRNKAGDEARLVAVKPEYVLMVTDHGSYYGTSVKVSVTAKITQEEMDAISAQNINRPWTKI